MFVFSFLIIGGWLPSLAQSVMHIPVELQWKGVKTYADSYDTLLYIGLESAEYCGPMPCLVGSIPIFDDQVKVDVALSKVKTASLSEAEMQMARNYSYNADFEVTAMSLRSRDEALLSYRIVPFRQKGNGYEKLLSATLTVTLAPDFSQKRSTPSYAHRSAMASGNWYKIGLQETGLYKLTYNDLNELGINLSGLDPRTLRVYHNGGGVLPELNAESRHDDLVEIPIYVSGEADGSFDQGDYLLFYGRGPVGWKYDALKQAYQHEPNPYDDYSYAFVVTGLGNGKRIGEAASPSGIADVQVTEFLDHQVHEASQYNLYGVGRTYYGDKIDGTSSKTFSFSFPNAIATRPCKLRPSLAGRNYNVAYFEVYVNEQLGANYAISTVKPTGGWTYAIEVGDWITTYAAGETTNVRLHHRATANTTSEGYVDYLLVNVWRALKMTGSQMLFRNPEASDAGKVYEYRLSDASQQVQVWDVTDPVAPALVKGQWNASTFSFKVNGDQDNEFLAFNGSDCLTATPFGRIGNQNLHGIRDVDFVILSYADFLPQAERLKALHATLDPDLNVLVTTPELVYNEFACGAKDISAIRDFCRMLYLDSNAGREIKYLLLLGDCSYDYKNRNGVVDFVPAFESVPSLDMYYSYVTDDFFGFMDENEGSLSGSLADIGIGRFPVSTLEQATQMVDKIERYVANDESTMRPWRNVCTFFADDENEFVRRSEEMEALVKKKGGEAVVVDKLYLDAFVQQSSPSGEICPEMNEALNSRMEKGTLVLNYFGHGGEVQLAVERILQKRDVDSWRNAPMYPLMITGTCEFSRYDDHMRTSLGEYSFLNQYGWMIAMFTTSRITQGNDNVQFCNGVYENLFKIVGGNTNRLGDVYRMAKTLGSKVEKRYVFFGDPALRLAYPKWKVETLGINGQFPGYDLDSIQLNDGSWQTYPIYHDTLSALQPVEIEGVVKDLGGNVASGFNGVVYVTVYDKEAELSTLGMGVETPTSEIPFKLYNSVIFNGKTDVVDGRFKIRFIVPRDIAYRYGRGMISYYATDYDVDANGRCEDFIIGGFYGAATIDEEPPMVRLFIDDTLFVNGSITGENPTLLAFIEDGSGINTTGSGIGHDILASLSGATRNTYCLNDYFVSEIDNPGKGQIAYKMQNLADGDYTLTLKVWDVYNNSGTASVNFTVVNSGGMSLDNVANYPNPVTDETFFTFDHNQVGSNLKVQIDIFDIMGRWVTRLTETMPGTSARLSPVRWNGKGAHGEPLRNGVYVYRILATNDNGESASAVSKLVLNK